jgi:Putative addiction module component
MEAIRKFIKVEGKTINITLPDDFYADEVEVIILPSENQHTETIPQWQIQQVRERSEAYKKNPSSALDFDEAIKKIEDGL